MVIHRAMAIQSTPVCARIAYSGPPAGGGGGGGGASHTPGVAAAPVDPAPASAVTVAVVTGGGTGGPPWSTGATSSTRRPSGRNNGVPHLLHVAELRSSDHFQHVGLQSVAGTPP